MQRRHATREDEREERTLQSPAQGASGHDGILGLQRGAGNAAVARMLVARVPAAAPPKRRKPQGSVEVADTEAIYHNLIGAVDQVVASKGGAADADWELLEEHEQLVAGVRRVLRLGYDDHEWNQALAAWTPLSGRLDAELAIARSVGVADAVVGRGVANVQWLRTVLEGGAYHEARREVLDADRTTAPDLAQAEPLMKAAEQRWQETKWFADKSKPLIGDAIGLAFKRNPGTGKALVDILGAPGSMREKLEQFKKAGALNKTATALDMANLVLDSTDNLAKFTVAQLGTHYRRFAAQATARGATKEAARLAQAAGKFETLAKYAETAGKAANVVGIVAEGIKLVDALTKDPPDWDAVFDAGMEIGLNVAELALGADGAPLLAIVMVVRAEIQVLQMVSDQLKWAKREKARMAAADFVDTAAKIARNQAIGFIADCELAVSAAQPAVQDIATRNIFRDAPKLEKSLDVLESHLLRDAKDSVGGYPDMVAALGDARRVLLSVRAEDPLNVAQNLETVFKGTNALARHVQERYKD